MVSKTQTKQQIRKVALQLRKAQERSQEFKSSYDSIIGAGVAWRDGYLKYCIQFDSVENLKRESSTMPDRVEDYPVDLGVGSYGEAAATRKNRNQRDHSISLFRQLWLRMRMRAF